MRFRALRIAIVAGIFVLLSGAPQAMSAASAACCGDECERGGRDDGGCPPTCNVGDCAKVRPAVDPRGTPGLDAPIEIGRASVARDAQPVLPVVTSGVFHPPRA
ncbi:hypothetical protein A2cp1_1082 [Anaeromyxobacter dehalogenans 2CP-1]|uniref:Uncharacterized protein n=2 Tax=Anaeromyxobacter dehalogenans TaxID=161493 RepID=B8JF75_ANAD2|nr:hypothetical protein A2cp1_1082 [Anaeromyxobacter dehalogenans 2CP-1]